MNVTSIRHGENFAYKTKKKPTGDIPVGCVSLVARRQRRPIDHILNRSSS